ncbi:FecR domain-containing protein [Pseudomonas sp. LRF_L74]|uniref:FecR domain-containing protein n=1 Tax=Pseudomonas sp. LRF_L74 TaxID=3369422 RepID=UPI003F61A9D4
MTGIALPSLPAEVVDQAIDWSIKLTYNRADASTMTAFDAWLASHEQHRQAWERVQSLGGRFAGMPAELALQTLEKLPEARLRRRQMIKLLSLFAAVGVGGMGAREVTPWQRLLADHSTQVGERGRWTLIDGSVLDLNTDSAVVLRFDESQREVELLRGELHLISGADAGSPGKRPLRVATAFGLFEALGTRFSVRLDQHGCRLGVSEGAVRLTPRDGTARVAQAGESWSLSAREATRGTATPQEVAAWRDGLLVARDMPLAEVLAELGRYRHGHIGCDPQISTRPISGNFNLTDIDATLDFLAQAHGLRLNYLTRYWLRVSV